MTTSTIDPALTALGATPAQSQAGAVSSSVPPVSQPPVPAIDPAMAALGATPTDMQSVQQGASNGPGLFHSMVQGLAGTVLPFVSSAVDVGGDINQIPSVLMGGKFTPSKVSDYSYFGNHPAVGSDANIFEPITTAKNKAALEGIVGQGIETGSMLIPGGEGVSLAKGVLPSLAKASLEGATGVGAYSAGEAMKEKKSAGDVGSATAEGVAIGAIAGPILGTAVKGLVDLGHFLATPAEQLQKEAVNAGIADQMNRLKTLKNSFDENIVTRDGVTTLPTDTLAKYNAVPEVHDTRVQMGHITNEEGTGILDEEIKSLNDKLTEFYKTRSATGESTPLSMNNFEMLTAHEIIGNNQLKAAGKVNATLAAADRMFKDYKSSYGSALSEADLNGIRKAMNKTFNPDTVDAERAIGNVTRDYLYNYTPDQVVRNNLAEQQKLIAAKEFAQKLNQTVVKGGRLGLYVARGLGAAVGQALPIGPLGPLVGAWGGDTAAKTFQNLAFKSPTAEVKAGLSKLIPQGLRSSIKDTTSTASKIGPIDSTVAPTEKGVKDLLPKKKDVSDIAKNAGALGMATAGLGAPTLADKNTTANSTPAVNRNLGELIAPAPKEETYTLKDRGVSVTNKDIQKALPVIFGEVSNRSPDKQELETRVILNTMLNRVKEYAAHGTPKTLAEVLAMPNQYQAYKGRQFDEFSKDTSDATTTKKKEKIRELVDKVTSEIKSGTFKDNTNGAVYYVHKPNGQIEYDDTRPLFKK